MRCRHGHGAGRRAPNQFELLCWDVKEVRCAIFKILYRFQQGVTCRCFMVPESVGDVSFFVQIDHDGFMFAMIPEIPDSLVICQEMHQL